jgi:hypothetical protein
MNEHLSLHVIKSIDSPDRLVKREFQSMKEAGTQTRKKVNKKTRSRGNEYVIVCFCDDEAT